MSNNNIKVTSDTLKGYQQTVIDIGRATQDKRKWFDLAGEPIIFKMLEDASLPLAMQIKRDANCAYKVWDSLAMLCGQAEHWTKADIKLLYKVAVAYCERNI